MKRFIIIAVLGLMVWLSYAAVISQSEAQAIGLSVFTHLSGSKPTFIESEAYFGSFARAEADFYILRFEPVGFILVAAEDCSIPVLGYSLENDFPAGAIPAHVSWYLDQYSRSIKEIRENPQWQVDASWIALRRGDYSDYNYTRGVSPLLSTTWDQDFPYNYSCPTAASGPGGRVYAGCVATAMAQVMKKWNHPATGVGSHSYYASGHGTQSANFGATTYNWSSMPNSISSVNTSIATLIYHCGVSVNMAYSASGSGAYAEDVSSAMINYFRYNTGAQLKSAASFSSSTWASMLRGDLDLGRPIIYRGLAPEGGHAFVLDGYQGTTSFHFNWGWSGDYNGYFYLNNLNPNSHNFAQNQGAILNLYPVSQANLTGTVSSAGTGLAGATVSVSGTTFTVTTNASGGYTLTGIPAGPAQIVASKTGYDPLSLSINLPNGQTSTLDFSLTEAERDDNYPPSNLQASVIGNDVHLSWNVPAPPAPGEWITWCHPEDIDNSIGTGAAVIFDVAHRYDSADLAAYQGSTLTHVSFVPREVNCVYTIKVWIGGTATTPGSMVHSQLVTAFTIDSWNEVELNTSIPIPSTGNLWFGYEVNAQAGFPAGCDEGPMVPGKGNIMRFNDNWTTLAQLSDIFTYNWLIQGFVAQGSAMVQMPEPMYEAPQASRLDSDNIARDQPKQILKVHSAFIPASRAAAQNSGIPEGTLCREPSLIGYKVWRLMPGEESNEALWSVLTPSPISPTTFQDVGWSALPGGSYKWAVKALYTADAISAPAFSNVLAKAVQTGNILGYVKRQENNAGIAGASVSAGAAFTTTTNSAGAYSLELPVGIYSLSASATGYNTLIQENIVVSVDQNTTADFFMTPASQIQSILLGSGWNLVSLNVSAADHSLPSLFAPISAQLMQVKGTEGVYLPDNPYSVLNALTDGKAYYIQLSAGAIWIVAGPQIPADTPLALEEGWNMAAYLPQDPMPVATAMQSVSTWLEQVKGIDGVYFPGNPYSTLTTMSPGKGYWIKLAGAHSLVYPVNRETVSTPEVAKPRLEVKALSSSMVLLARCDWAQPGDILSARVNKELRGAQELIAPEGFPAALLQIYTEAANEEISLWLVQADGTEIELANRFSSQPNATLGSYPEFIILEPKTEAEDIAVPSHFHSCYPNPFNPSTTISFSVGQENTMVNVDIYNLKGQKVRQLTQTSYSPGYHRLNWDGTDDEGRTLSSGIYLIELKAGKYRKAAKVMLAK
ncbi:MAG: C10 family peptidase [Candidatus Cloacimonetes bacterium]|nr:C10 family peptidase [Candidatus Cloacimonadota bacterium]MDY0172116.1 C10 family peptidase [Candidatus Cloacimonadaceae bacterium]